MQRVLWVTGVWAQKHRELYRQCVERWAGLRPEGQGGEGMQAVTWEVWASVER